MTSRPRWLVLTVTFPLGWGGVAAAETAYVQSQWVTPGLPVVSAPLLIPNAPAMFAPVAGSVVATPILPGPAPTVMPLVPPPIAPATLAAPAPAPAAAPMAAAALPAAAALGSYTVRKGAHLAVVAQRTGTSLAALVALNPKLDPTALLPAGTRVLLPVAGNW